jgi:hypothetical protein
VFSNSTNCPCARAETGLRKTLSEAGLVYEDNDPNDKRFLLIYPLGGGGENSTQVKDEDPQEEELDIGVGLEEFMYKSEEDSPSA